MGRRWTQEDYEHTTRQIERWISEANHMWAGAQNSIQRVRQVQDTLIKHSQTPRNNLTEPWVEG
jgi:hypothetical protein